MDLDAQYDGISDPYSLIADRDPSKYCVQFPWARAQLPEDVSSLNILDIGCGEGELSRSLAREGARVIAFDESTKLIHKAKGLSEVNNLGIQYFVADARSIVDKVPKGTVDCAISTCVLHYAEDREHLNEFFTSTARLLKPGGTFAALVSNSDYRRFGETRYNRHYVKEGNGGLRVDFIDQGRVICSALYRDFLKQDYERCIDAQLWSSFTWRSVLVDHCGAQVPPGFWDGFEEDCPYVGFVATRR